MVAADSRRRAARKESKNGVGSARCRELGEGVAEDERGEVRATRGGDAATRRGARKSRMDKRKTY